jgi:hypothetical protein
LNEIGYAWNWFNVVSIYPAKDEVECFRIVLGEVRDPDLGCIGASIEHSVEVWNILAEERFVNM